MPTPVTVGGSNYNVPLYNEIGWAQGTGNISQLLIALAAVSGTQSSVTQLVAVSTTPSSIVNQKTYLVDTAGLPIQLNLPAPAANTWFGVKDTGFSASANPITIHRFASEMINGLSADMTLVLDGGYWFFACDGTDWWLLTASSLTGQVWTTPDGLHTYRVAIDNDGSITTEAIT